MERSQAMSDVYLVEKRRRAFMDFLSAENSLNRFIRFGRTTLMPEATAERLKDAIAEGVTVGSSLPSCFTHPLPSCFTSPPPPGLTTPRLEAELFFNQAMACNLVIKAIIIERGVDRLLSPELPTIGATRAWAASLKERWVDLEKRFEGALTEFQRCGDDFECCKSEVMFDAEAQAVRDLGPLQVYLSLRREEGEVAEISESNPIRVLDHHSPPNDSDHLTSFTQVSFTPRTQPLKPLKQKEDTTTLAWSFSYGLGRPLDEFKDNWQMLQEELKKMKAPKCFRASSSVEGVKTLTTDLEEPVEAPSSWNEPFEERSIRRGFLSNRKPFKQFSKVHAISFHRF